MLLEASILLLRVQCCWYRQ